MAAVSGGAKALVWRHDWWWSARSGSDEPLPLDCTAPMMLGGGNFCFVKNAGAAALAKSRTRRDSTRFRSSSQLFLAKCLQQSPFHAHAGGLRTSVSRSLLVYSQSFTLVSTAKSWWESDQSPLRQGDILGIAQGRQRLEVCQPQNSATDLHTSPSNNTTPASPALRSLFARSLHATPRCRHIISTSDAQTTSTVAGLGFRLVAVLAQDS